MYDYDRKSYLNGNDDNIFDFATKSYICITYQGLSFSGFDRQTGDSFNGIVNGFNISIYDYNLKTHFNYIIK